jgi:hypothetical protein
MTRMTKQEAKTVNECQITPHPFSYSAKWLGRFEEHYGNKTPVTEQKD